MTEKGPPILKKLLAKPGIQVFLFIFTLLYVISPIDIIPDVIPVFGWLDDAAIIVAQIASFIVYLKEIRRRHTETNTQQTEGN